jgi:hypothetical protein
MRDVLMTVLAALLASPLCAAQDASRGVLMPFTISGGVVVSDRARAADPDAARAVPGFRAVFYPSLKIDSHWFAYSAIQVQSRPFLYYDAFYPQKDVDVRVHQLLLGYSWNGEDSAVSVRIGELPSAFGSFPLRYDDTANPLLDQPLGYGYIVKLRPDQLPCGVGDLVHQHTYPLYIEHYCGGSTEQRRGMTAVTLEGLPGTEVSGSWNDFDGRFQVTNSSPSNPQDLRSDSQHIQWTAGAGYTIRQGLRVGVSGFRGPFLENDVKALLDPGKSVRDYPAVGIGTEVQWGRGRWNAVAEWQRIEFNYPGFEKPPAVSSAFLELKATLNPRFYAAFRGAYESNGRVKDNFGGETEHFLPNRQSYEFAVGYRVNRFQTLKVGYEVFRTTDVIGSQDNVFGVQFVTSVHALSKAFGN